MSVSSLQNDLKRIDKELADEEKKKASYDKKAADMESKIAMIRKSINNHTSPGVVQTKTRQIENYDKERVKDISDSAKCSERIAKISEKRRKTNQQFQSALASERKKQEQDIHNIRQMYESEIRKISTITTPIIQPSQTDDPVEYDVFISHASEDKEPFVNGLVNELEQLGIKAWYDSNNIKWGDSFREKIEEGLKHSRFGIAVLSPAYISEGKYWTKAELDAFFQKDTVNGKYILPIWYNLSREEVEAYSPIIAGRHALQSKYTTAAGMAQALKEILDQERTKS